MGTIKVTQETTRAALEDMLDAFTQGDTDRLATGGVDCGIAAGT